MTANETVFTFVIHFEQGYDVVGGAMIVPGPGLITMRQRVVMTE